RRLAGAQAGARGRPVRDGPGAGVRVRHLARRLCRLPAGAADGLHGAAAGARMARVAGGPGAVAGRAVDEWLAARVGGAARGFREQLTCAESSASSPTMTWPACSTTACLCWTAAHRT